MIFYTEDNASVGLDNGLAPNVRQAFIWCNDGTGPLMHIYVNRPC